MKNYFHQDNIIHVRYSLIVWFGSITLLKKDVILNAVFSFKKSSRRQNCLLQYNAVFVHKHHKRSPISYPILDFKEILYDEYYMR